jgi:SAM-dependent MidA family methyltransferase
MNELEMKIINKIEREGPVTFEKFMEMALYDPGYGYYTSGKSRIGREGDFYTSPHLHPVFGKLIGKQVEEMWEFMGRPREFKVVEFGPGSGLLCKDVLAYLKGRELFFRMNYLLIEKDAAAKERQKDMLREVEGKVQWISSLTEAGAMRGCIFSNELLDSFPVHIVMMEDALKEIYVTAEGQLLKEVAGPLSTPALEDYFREFHIDPGRGYRTEVNLRIRDWLKEASAVLREGFVFTIDYGYSSRDYYSEDRDRGTLMCYYRHQLSEDLLQNVGEQDITSHVNFSSLKKWGEDLDLKTVGYCSQGAFYVAMGIDEEIKRLSAESGDYLSELWRIKKMILPQGMGESHMVMVQYKGAEKPSLRGFSISNRIKSL